MAKLTRKLLKVFGINANGNEIGQFGAVATATKKNTNDINEIQALEAWGKGWGAGTVSANRYPSLQERTGVDYVHSYQLGYILQEGVAEWNSETEYQKGSLCKVTTGNDAVLYRSLEDGNIGNAVSIATKWAIFYYENQALDLLKLAYPIGHVYLGITATCPLAALFGTWEKLPGDRVLQTSGTLWKAGDLPTQGLPDHNHSSPNFMATLSGTGFAILTANGNDLNGSTGMASARNSTYSQPQGRVQPYAYVVNAWVRTA